MKMRIVSGIAVVVALCANADGLAQQAKFSMRPRYSHQLLFEFPECQKELALSSQQLARLTKIRDEVAQQAKELREDTRLRAEQEQDVEAARMIMREGNRTASLMMLEAEPRLLNVLDRRQRARLTEIQLQASGPGSFMLAGMSERLNMSPEQVAEIQRIFQEGRQEEGRIIDSYEPKRDAAITALKNDPKFKDQRAKPDADALKPITDIQSQSDARVQELVKACEKRIARVLTKKQWATYQKMRGKPFIVNGAFIPVGAGAKKDGEQLKGLGDGANSVID